jgi:thymidylate kinase
MHTDKPEKILVVLLNGPLGVGKSTLAEVLGESLDSSVVLDGDGLVAVNPPPGDEITALHETLTLLVSHYYSRGYYRFIINHYWSSGKEIAELRTRLQSVAAHLYFHCYRLTLPAEENLRRISRRRKARAIEESAFEDRQFSMEYEQLANAKVTSLVSHSLQPTPRKF